MGWVIAPPDLTGSIRKVHDFLTVGAAAPLQQASAFALGWDDSYYRRLAGEYQARRDFTLQILQEAGFRCFRPQGAYYVMTDTSDFEYPSDLSFVRYLIETIGVAAVPGSSFYSDPCKGAHKVRFCFCKKYETLREAERRLSSLRR